MKEPEFWFVYSDVRIPYSQAQVDWLKCVLSDPDEYFEHDSDHDFRRRYAAILLAERGQ